VFLVTLVAVWSVLCLTTIVQAIAAPPAPKRDIAAEWRKHFRPKIFDAPVAAFAMMAPERRDLLAQATDVPPDSGGNVIDPAPRPVRSLLGPHVAEISGPRIMVIGEAIHLTVDDDSGIEVANRLWKFEPEPSWKLYGTDRREVWFGSSEAGAFRVSVTSIRTDYGAADASWLVELIAKPGKGGMAAPDAGASRPTPEQQIAEQVVKVQSRDRPRDAREIASAMMRAVQGADRGLLSPYTVLAESRAMADIALKNAGASIEPWAEFFVFLDELFSQFEESGEFREPRRRVLALKAVAAVLGKVKR
jgi:hypothetical protein